MSSGYALTNFPNGITSFGIPIFGGSLPPFTGQYLFADYLNGNDGNDGSPGTPLKTVQAAYAKANSGANDVIFIVGNGNYPTATQRITSTITWDKDAVHLIGLAAPSRFTPMARIAYKSTVAAELAPMMEVSGNGCIFSNFSMYQGLASLTTAEQMIQITGGNNYFGGIHFGGMGGSGSTGGSAHASSYCIGFGTNGSENFFENCTIGIDTVQRTAANASIKFYGVGSTRNVFQNCIFPMDGLNANTPYFIDASLAGSVDRDNIFRNCYFYNTVNSTATVLSVGSLAPVTGSPAGTLVFDNCTGVGFTKWTATSAYCYVTGPATGAGTTAGIGATIA